MLLSTLEELTTSTTEFKSVFAITFKDGLIWDDDFYYVGEEVKLPRDLFEKEMFSSTRICLRPAFTVLLDFINRPIGKQGVMIVHADLPYSDYFVPQSVISEITRLEARVTF